MNIEINEVSPYTVDPNLPLDDLSNQFLGDKAWIAQDVVEQNLDAPPIAPIVRVVPYFTAIVQVKEGVVVGIIWDDGCYGCSSSSAECIEGMTGSLR